MLKFLRFAPACVLTVALTSCGAGTTAGSPIGSGSLPSHGAPTPAPGTSSSPAPGTSSSPTPAPGSSTSPLSSNVCGGTNSPAPAIPFPAASDSDAFYGRPSPFPSSPPGTILSSRSVTYAPNGVTMTNKAWELKFVSCDVNDKPIAAVATVVLPLVPATGTEPLLVEAFAEDALGAQCAPSHLLTGSTAETLDEVGVPDALQATGWTVVYPDFEGPSSEYAVGKTEGHITLDAIKAVEAFAPAGLNAKTPVGMNGYSGGAEAVSWGATLQHTYAPNLNIVGIASGGTPADLVGIVDNIDGTSAVQVASNALFFNIIYMSAVGINRGFPQLMTPILNAAGVAAAVAMENGCGGKDSNGSGGPAGTFANYTTTNIDTAPGVLATVPLWDLAQPGKPPVSNEFVYSSITDELIPIAGVDKMVAAWCAAGATIEYDREATGGDHVTTELDSTQDVVAYMTGQYLGLGVVVPLGSTTCN